MKANHDTPLQLGKLADEQLLSLGANDEEIVTVLITRYMGFISDKARRMTSVRADADDLMQEGLLALLDAIRTFHLDKGTKFSTYASVCISNRMKSAILRNNKKDIPALFLSEKIEGQPAQGSNPESILLAKEKAQEISEIIRRILSPLERDTLLLFLHGSSYEQMAQKLGTSQKSVDNALQRARKKLKTGFLPHIIHP